MTEEWKELPFNPNYEVSTLGKIRNKETKHILKEKDNGHGYKIVNLYLNSNCKVCYIHRAVALTFLPNPLNKEEVNHIDGIKSNNKLNNIEWCTRSENNKHAYKIGLRVATEKVRANSRKQLLAINSNSELRAIALAKAAFTNSQKSQAEYMLSSSNQFKPLKCVELNRLFLTARRAQDKLGIKKGTIQKAMSLNHTFCGGYHWYRIEKHRFNNYGKSSKNSP